MFIVRAFIKYTITVAVWTRFSFHGDPTLADLPLLKFRLTNLYAGAMDLTWNFNKIAEHCPVKSSIYGVDGDK